MNVKYYVHDTIYKSEILFFGIEIEIAEIGPAILADTVGFIRHLPHDLVAAFKATLQETQQADLLLHIIDASDEAFRENIEAVESVLEEIGAHEIPVLHVMNKIDKLDPELSMPHIERNDTGQANAVWISAQQGTGMDNLFQALTERLSTKIVECNLQVPTQHQGKLRSILFKTQSIIEEQYDDAGNWLAHIRIQQADWLKLQKKEPQAFSDSTITT